MKKLHNLFTKIYISKEKNVKNFHYERILEIVLVHKRSEDALLFLIFPIPGTCGNAVAYVSEKT